MLTTVNAATQRLEQVWLADDEVACITVRIFKRYGDGDALLPDPGGREFAVPLDLVSSPMGYRIDSSGPEERFLTPATVEAES